MTKRFSPAFLRLSARLAGFGALALFADHAMAEAISDVASNTFNNFQSVADVLSGGAYLGGAGFAIKAAMKMRDHHEDPQRTKLGAPITYGVVAGALLGLPTFMTVGGESTLGSSESKNSLSKSVLGS